MHKGSGICQESSYCPIKGFGLRKEFDIPRPILAGAESLLWLRNDCNARKTSLLTEGKGRSRACGMSNSCLGQKQKK